jgi:hypothetical protein
MEDLECDFVLVKPSGYHCPIEDRPEAAVRTTPALRGTAAISE